MRPAMLQLVKKLATAKGRAEVHELTQWADRALRDELAKNISSHDRLAHGRRLEVVDLLDQTVRNAARIPGLNKASTRELDEK